MLPLNCLLFKVWTPARLQSVLLITSKELKLIHSHYSCLYCEGWKTPAQALKRAKEDSSEGAGDCL